MGWCKVPFPVYIFMGKYFSALFFYPAFSHLFLILHYYKKRPRNKAGALFMDTETECYVPFKRIFLRHKHKARVKQPESRR